MAITLTADQMVAYNAIITLLTTDQTELVILGGAGTGKTTLVNTFLAEWETLTNVSPNLFPKLNFELTATTNKAADALAAATGRPTRTIHSVLGLRVVSQGYNQSYLADNGNIPEAGSVLIIDESSFIDKDLLLLIQTKARYAKCKVIYLGDHCQLKPVNSDTTPVFSAGFKTVELKQIVRQADTSPIQALSRNLRELVSTGTMPNAGVDGVNILHMPQADFEEAFKHECKVNPSVRALTWTNKAANYYNELAALSLYGDTEFKVGNLLNLNKQLSCRDKWKLPTDTTIEVTSVSPWDIDRNGITYQTIGTTHGIELRHPADYGDVIAIIKEAYNKGNLEQAYVLENKYADLRRMYASTVNKAQGSTYSTVFIDLNDIGKCRDRDQVNRMLYVAASRAKDKIVFTGDI